MSKKPSLKPVKRVKFGCDKPVTQPNYDYQKVRYSSGGVSVSDVDRNKTTKQIAWPKNFAL